MKSHYPCIVGRFSLNHTPLPSRPVGHDMGAEPLLLCKEAAVDVYRLNEVPGLYHAGAKGEFALLLGDVFPLPSETQHTWEKEPGQFLKWSRTARLKQHNGAFILLHIAWNASGEYEARLATDKYGFRTLFYHQAGSVLYFASHLSGLKYMLDGSLPGISHEALLHYYHFGVTPSEATFLEGVKKMPAASVLTVKHGTVEIAPYFDPLDLYEPERYARSGAAAISREIDECMTRSVSQRITKGERIGLAVSGGVDSGYIAQKLKQAGVAFQGYNLAYGDYNEHDRVDRLASNLGIEITRIRITAAEIIESFEVANSLGSEPVILNDAALRILARRARADGISVIWDGDGADRLFLGMNSHRKYLRVFRLYQALRRLRLVMPLAYVLQRSGFAEARKLAVVLKNWSSGIPAYTERKYSGIDRYNDEIEQQIFELGVERIWTAYRRRIGIYDFGLFITYFSIRLCPELFFHTPLEQQFSLGLRPVSPYWDDRLVSLALSIPTNMKLRGRKTKYVLRKTAALKSEDAYWMLPKIGLYNAFPYVRSTEEGKEWIAAQQAKVRSTSEYGYLRDALGGAEPNADHLIPYIIWKEAQLGDGLSFSRVVSTDVAEL